MSKSSSHQSLNLDGDVEGEEGQVTVQPEENVLLTDANNTAITETGVSVPAPSTNTLTSGTSEDDKRSSKPCSYVLIDLEDDMEDEEWPLPFIKAPPQAIQGDLEDDASIASSSCDPDNLLTPVPVLPGLLPLLGEESTFDDDIIPLSCDANNDGLLREAVVLQGPVSSLSITTITQELDDSDPSTSCDPESRPPAPAEDVEAEEVKKKKNPKADQGNRCRVCHKKVGLTGGITCRCGGLFCSQHRYSDQHDCSFDYKQLGAEEIKKNNPVVVGEKIRKI